MKRILYALFYILVFAPVVSSQVFFTILPKHMQMFPRFENTYGECVVEGTCINATTFKSVLSEHHTGVQVELIDLHVAANSSFKLVHQVPAKLCEYDLTVYAASQDSSSRVLKKITNLVAGDFFIVQGQSNAECGFSAGGREHDSIHYNAYNRAIGGNIGLVTTMMPDSVQISDIHNDCLFGRPHSNFWNDSERAYSGVWAVRLQNELALATGIPNCVVNGSQGGCSIAQFFASHTPSIPDSLQHSPDYKKHIPYKLYDRVYKRLYENKATLGVKGVFWYQGETDATFKLDSSASYSERFAKLYTSWLADYPNIKNIVVLQLNMGCSYINNALIREIQRKLPMHFQKVVTMSTVGSPLSDRLQDLCHYNVEGYSRIAEKLIPLSKKLFYDFPLRKKEILPPNIQNVYYSSSTELTLEFDMDILVEDSCLYEERRSYAYLKDYFFDQDYHKIKVDFISTENEKLYLDISNHETPISKLTYLPQTFTDMPELYAGPWIRNATNTLLAAYTFFEFPVPPPPILKKTNLVNQLLVSPNPASDQLKIALPTEKQCVFELTDITGKIVLTGALKNGESIFSVADLKRGLYFLKLWEDTQVEVRKIILK